MLKGWYAKLEARLGTNRYPTLQSFSSHVNEMASRLPPQKQHPKPPEVPLTPLHLAILAHAPRHRRGSQYNIVELAERLKGMYEFRGMTQEKRKSIIENKMQTLAKRGLLTLSMDKLPRIRKATRREIEERIHLIGEVLRNKTPWPKMARAWPKFLEPQQAHSIGLQGLTDALEIRDPTTMHPDEFEGYARLRIGSRIASAIRSKHKENQRDKRTFPLKEEKHVAKESKSGEKEVQKALKIIHRWHTTGIIDAHEATMLALRHVMDKTQRQMSSEFGIKANAISAIETKAKQKLRAKGKRLIFAAR
ncbi:MAG: hypothetical protein Q8R15_02925 [Candidatus Micrarchaeota archaeon]|nr:hypothetical protein [Candidatus Micrarchaeota archaeon]